jgi:MFS family permease
LRIFSSPGLGATSVIRGFLITGMYATFFIGVLYLQHVRGFSVLQTGLAFLPMTLMLALLSSGITARLVSRFGPKPPLVAGLLSAAAGLALWTQVGAQTSYVPTVVGALLLQGVGAGLAFMPLLTIAMADVPLADAGLASGIVNTSLQLSAALGVAVLGTLSTDRTQSLVHAGTSHIPALLSGYHLAYAVGVGAITVAVLVAVFTIRNPRRPELVTEVETDGLGEAVQAEAA